MENVRFSVFCFVFFMVTTLVTTSAFFAYVPISVGSGSENNCVDEIDNDSDSFVDCNDQDCASDPACDAEVECTDEADNDNDSFVDCNDQDCASDPACDAEFECTDDVDNDSDSFVDCNDQDCASDPACL